MHNKCKVIDIMSQAVQENHKPKFINYKVKQLAELAGVTTDVVRYYTRISLLEPKQAEENGYNLYNTHDLHRLRFIRCAKSLGYTLTEIADIIIHSTGGKSPCLMVRDIVEKRIVENRNKLEELTKLQNRMEKAVKKWSGLPDKLPNGNSVCHLIESFGEF